LSTNTTGLEIDDATAKTPLQAVLSLQVAQTHLLELMKDEDGKGKYTKAFESVQEAINLIGIDTLPSEH
jgi:hypothetical protein